MQAKNDDGAAGLVVVQKFPLHHLLMAFRNLSMTGVCIASQRQSSISMLARGGMDRVEVPALT